MQLLIFLSGISGICITFTAATAVSLCGPYATNISGVFKDAVLSYIGFIFFKVKPPSLAVQAGIAMSFAGAIYYIIGKLPAKKSADPKTAEADKK